MTITVYSRTVCPQCGATKRKLAKHGLAYQEINVEHDETAAQMLRDKGYLQAPVVVLSDGREWFGFRPDLIEELAAEVAS